MGDGQILASKRKGRPPKSDPSISGRSPATRTGTTVRRGLRRRNVRFGGFIDCDDFMEDDFEVDEEDLSEAKLLVKRTKRKAHRGRCDDGANGISGSDREEQDEDEESEREVVKKRKVSVREVGNEMDDNDDLTEDGGGGRRKEDSGWKGNSRGRESFPGSPHHSLPNVPLPDKKTLELILNKLQKKDIYGVYAEPVDPEELPDYHEIIENPMDFSTVRKKLANGSYVTLDQFESDVFLICTNAMQYNAPDSVYSKQARNIQELGRKKLLKLRIKYERSLKETRVEQRLENDREYSERDLKSDQGVKPNLSTKKLARKPLSESTQEPVSSDFSGGAMPATPRDLPRNSAANRGGYDEGKSINDGLMDGNVASAENFSDKVEEVSMGRGFSSRLGQKPSVYDENRRATYTMLSHPGVSSNSIFSTFDGEMRDIVAVALQEEYSYSRSLARFAGSLGPIAWKVASQRIEKSLPSDCKFGRGWVVEYDPVSTAVIFTPKSPWEFPSTARTLSLDVQLRNEGLPFKVVPSAKTGAVLCPAQAAPQSSISHGISLGSLGSTTMKNHHVLSPFMSYRALPATKAVKQFELNSLLSMPHNNGDAAHVPEEKSPGSSRFADPNTRDSTPVLRPESVVSRSRETATASINARQMLPFMQLHGNGIPGKKLKWKVPKTGLDSSKTISPCTGIASKMPVQPICFPQQDQGLSDPVQMMRLLSEKAQGQQTSPNPADSRVMQTSPSTGRDQTGNISGSWMSIGAGGVKLPKQNSEAQKIQSVSALQYHISPQEAANFRSSELKAEKNGLPFRGLVQAPTFAFNEARFCPQAVPSPQSIPADFYQFQVQQSLWGGAAPHPPARPRQKQDSLPPDLNIGFQPAASPVKQSPGVTIDSQLPDLALQL